jgi:hypothetical protein
VNGAVFGSLLGAAVAAIMLVTTQRVDTSESENQRAVRLILRTFITGLLVQGLVGFSLAVSLDESGSPVSVIGGLLLGAGAVGLRFVFGRFETSVHAHAPIDVLRRRAIIEAAIAEASESGDRC